MGQKRAKEIRRLLAGVPTVKGVTILLALALAAGLLGGVAVYRFWGGRPSGVGQPLSPAGAALQARLQADPNDLSALLRLAHIHLDQGHHGPALDLYRRVLELDANNVEAIAHLGVILYASGQVDAALAQYDRALALDPTYAHALWDKALALRHGKRDPAGAIRTWEAFIRLMPPGSQDAVTARGFIDEARSELGGRGRQPKPAPATGGKGSRLPGEAFAERLVRAFEGGLPLSSPDRPANPRRPSGSPAWPEAGGEGRAAQGIPSTAGRRYPPGPTAAGTGDELGRARRWASYSA